ncbi:MAG: hypothetical protein LBU10_00645 [Endomicrobium sp.]|jgi:hypothetical protein|nr:hypothetical protein [Endomicrobium sp.]
MFWKKAGINRMFGKKEEISRWLGPIMTDLEKTKQIFESSEVLEDFSIDASVKLEIKGLNIDFDITYPAQNEKMRGKHQRKEI